MSLIKERLYKIRNEPNVLKRYFLRRYLFRLFEKLGLHVVADHFYEPIPNLTWIRKNYDESKYLPAGAEWNFNQMEHEMLSAIEAYAGEFFEATDKTGYCKNYYFQYWDALCLFIYIRSRKIHKVVEIGQGYSTLVSQAALDLNKKKLGLDTKLISIDPYGRLQSQKSATDTSGIETINKSVQDISTAEIIRMLDQHSLLFVDSSHIFKAGSDVEFLTKHVYPRLPDGCHLHIHDIYSPYPWPKAFYTDRKWFWNEQDLLEQYLAHNNQFHLNLAAHWLYKESIIIHDKLSEYDSRFLKDGSSFYLQKKHFSE